MHVFDKFCFPLSSARIDSKNLADSKIVKESAVLFEKLPETLASENLKKAGLDESSPSEIYKDTSPVAVIEKPENKSEKVEVAPSFILTPSTEKVIVDDEV